jgi:selenocysteine lyase/cysteine desulfurase
MIALIHASNVSGALQPIARVGEIAAEHEILFLVDAAQSLGQVPLDVGRCGIHMLAAPGHKGLLGPLGTGILYVSSLAAPSLRSVRQGGTGTHSQDDVQPADLPSAFESGNHNVPGIAGLLAGVNYVLDRGVDQIRSDERGLAEQLVTGLREIGGVTVLGPDNWDQRVGVISMVLDAFDPQEVAAMLDAGHRIQVRSGLHCAPLAHRALGTLDRGGTIRFSIGPFNTSDQIELALRAVAEIASTVAF